MRPRITYANVVSTLALLMVLSGGTYAATQLPKNSVGAKQLQKNSVVTKKIKNDAVDGTKVKNGSLAAADLQPSALSGFMKGRRISAQLTLTPGITYQTLITVPGVGPVAARCQDISGFTDLEVDFTNTTTSTFRLVSRKQSEDPDENVITGGSFNPGGTWPTTFNPSNVNDAGRYLQLTVLTGPTVTVELHAVTRPAGATGCSVSATAYAS